MADWDRVIPYNAIHMVEVSVTIETSDARQAISQALEPVGWRISPSDIQLDHFDSTQSRPEFLSYCEQGLNSRFEGNQQENPFRFYLSPSDSGRAWLGVCYYHPVASADSICWLLEDIISILSDPLAPKRMAWQPLRRARYRYLFTRQIRSLLATLGKVRSVTRRAKQFSRIQGKRAESAKSKIIELPLSAGQLAWIKNVKQQTGAKYNDVLMGLLLHTIGKEFPERFPIHPRRKDLAVGSIINLRNLFSSRHSDTFGVYLGMFAVSHPIAGMDEVADVIRAVRQQTEEIKTSRLHLQNLFVIAFGTIWNGLISEERRAKSGKKNFPLVAGITSFYVESFQRRLTSLPVEQYWRSVSVSPTTPLVLSATTFRGQSTLTFIYNEAIYSADEVDRLITRLKAITH